jgi:predicted small metal-binding protein
MSMLLIDGVNYHEWTPRSEDEFEQTVKEHAKDIFGEQSIYPDIKHKLKTKSGIGSIPDGYVIIFGDEPQWHIVEVELSSHPLYEHIVPQVSKFINGIKNPPTQKDIVDALYQEIGSDEFLKLRLKKAIGTTETYKFLSDLISKPPLVTIIIEKHTEQLDEAVSAIAHSQIKVVELQTFTREGVGLSVHAHLFEPLYKVREPLTAESVTSTKVGVGKVKATKRVTLQDLVDAKLLNSGQKISSNYKNARYEAEITATSKLRLLHDNTTWNSLSEAAQHITGIAINGWIWWHTLKDGQEYSMDDIRRKLP